MSSPAVTPTQPTWPVLLRALLAGTDLGEPQARWAMAQVMGGEASPVHLAAFLVALRAKGESVAELTALAEEMLAHARLIDVPGRCLDIVGTGGDLMHTVNISTMAAIVAAASGVRVVKHGNRAASSSSGTADVLESLGLRLDQTPERVAELASEVGITFCFAQVFHPSFRHAGPVRRELGIPTAFNVLGPLTNPARPAAAAIGCPDARLAPLMAGVLARRGVSGVVFRGPRGPRRARRRPVRPMSGGSMMARSRRSSSTPSPTSVSTRSPWPTCVERTPRSTRTSCGACWRVRPGPVRQTVLLNAAAGLAAEGSLPGTGEGPLVDRLAAGLRLAAAAVDDGRARELLARWVDASQR